MNYKTAAPDRYGIMKITKRLKKSINLYSTEGNNSKAARDELQDCCA